MRIRQKQEKFEKAERLRERDDNKFLDTNEKTSDIMSQMLYILYSMSVFILVHTTNCKEGVSVPARVLITRTQCTTHTYIRMYRYSSGS